MNGYNGILTCYLNIYVYTYISISMSRLIFISIPIPISISVSISTYLYIYRYILIQPYFGCFNHGSNTLHSVPRQAARVTLGTNLFGAQRLTEALLTELTLGDPKGVGSSDIGTGWWCGT